MKSSIIIFILLGLFTSFSSIFADDPPYYVKSDTWQETMRASREALMQLEQRDELGNAMPDFGASNFTVLVWVKTADKRSTIFMKGNSAVYIDNGILKFGISGYGEFSSDVKINDDQWHHVALSGKELLNFYIDGKLIKSGRFVAADNLLPDESYRMAIGSGNWTFPFRGRSRLIGLLDEVYLYNRQLSTDEVQAVYKNNIKVDKGLVAWWPFEKDAADASGNNNNGRIGGFGSKPGEGRFGQGLILKEGGSVSISRRAGKTPRMLIWDLIARDFNSNQEKQDIEIEKRNKIWQQDWNMGDLKELANRYAKKTTDFATIRQSAQELARTVEDLEGLNNVRGIYQFSIAAMEMMPQFNSLRQGIDYLKEQYPQDYTKSDEFLSLLDALELELKNITKQFKNLTPFETLQQKLQNLKYEALVSNNPLINFDKLLFAKRYTYQSSHYYTDFIDGTENPGGNLSILSLKNGEVKDILPVMSEGIFGRYDLSFDATKVIFDWKEKIGKGVRIFETGIDGQGLRQVTFEPADEQERIAKYDNSSRGGTARVYYHHTDDMQPCYLPDGRIVFTSTRCEYGVLCDGPDVLTTSVLYRMDADGSNMVKLTNSAVSEFSPAITHDGRILYNRWEYIDKGQIGVKCLWAMHPDGSNSVEIFGNDIALPPVFNHARPIPGFNNLFVTLGTPHYPSSGVGTVIRLDINKPIRTREPMTYITPLIDIRAEPGFDHWIDGEWVRTQNGPLYMDPFPLNDKFYLVSHNPDKPWNDISAYGLYLLDEFGNHVLIYKDSEYSCWEPRPLIPRETPPVIPSVRPSITEEEMATVVLSDVYVGLTGVERGTIKYLRVMEQVPRPWDCRRFWEEDGGAPAVSMGSVLGLKVLHGIVPVYEDGSAHFEVPPNLNLYIQALDEKYLEIQRQRTYVNYRPKEKRSCIGCHELRQLAPANKPTMALNYPPSKLAAQPGEIAPRAVHYPTDVQPVLDKHCIQCHSGNEPAADLDLGGELTRRFTRSYESILRKGLVKTFNEGADFDGTEAVPPRSVGSYASKLITTLLAGHQEVKLSQEEMIKIATWVDANAQYYGSWYGRRDIRYKDHPDFRPVPTFSEAISSKSPYLTD
jgi:hypothetical protein